MVGGDFSTLLVLDKDGDIKLRSEGFRDVVSATDQIPFRSTFVVPTKCGITPAEVKICRRFVRNAYGEEDFNRFDFGGFF